MVSILQEDTTKDSQQSIKTTLIFKIMLVCNFEAMNMGYYE